MTPRIKDTNTETALGPYSEQLVSQLEHQKREFDLTGEGGLFEILHPALIKTKYLYDHHPQDISVKNIVHGRMIISFKSKEESQLLYPNLPNFEGMPWHIFQFLQQDPPEALIHFGALGSAHLSKTSSGDIGPAKLELHHYLLPVWLDYALSPELWGPSGKWVRFHERFHTLFMQFGLLIDQSQIGYYRLHKEASWLKTKGFSGKLTSMEFTIIPKWDFPLSGLIELEKILAREP